MTCVLTGYERPDRFALVGEEGPAGVQIIPVGDPRVAKGDLIHGFFRGEGRTFLGLWFTPGQMWIADSRTTVELEPTTRREEVRWRSYGPLGVLAVFRDGERLLRYRYRRPLDAMLLDRGRFPEHDFARWIAHGWHAPSPIWAADLRAGHMSPAQWVDQD